MAPVGFPLVFLLVFVLLRNHIFLPESSSVTSFAALIMQDIVLKGRREQGDYQTETRASPLAQLWLVCSQAGSLGSDELRTLWVFPAPSKGLAFADRKKISVMPGPSELDPHSLQMERSTVNLTEGISYQVTLVVQCFVYDEAKGILALWRCVSPDSENKCVFLTYSDNLLITTSNCATSPL